MKKILALLTICNIMITLVSCNNSKNHEETDVETSRDITSSDTEQSDDFTTSESTVQNESLQFQIDEFDLSLIDYLLINGYYSSDFIVSPAAFRASLCLAAAGAQGTTRTNVVKAAGFSGIDEMNMWYNNYLYALSAQPTETGTPEEYTFDVFNSIWSNTDYIGSFTDSYTTLVWNQYAADACSASNTELSSEIENWLKSKTHGEITSIPVDVSGASSVLMSALYMQAPSTQASEITGTFQYVDETGTQILVIPFGDNLNCVFFTGNKTNMFDKLSNVKPEKVHAVLPVLEMESAFDANDLLNFLISRDISDAYDSTTANFHNMCRDSDWFLQEIVHTAKISLSGAAPNYSLDTDSKSEPIEFSVGESFSFAVFSDFGTPYQQLMLFGQIQK